ncbi:S8 family serine peptidase [Humibacillus xanthopallidus]|uniref:PA domain-containing protein n=1 Tax=Humibacillus xanthopallidus TaxID=412689 RepID=A0A543I1Y3_9MICO|nr:S8 family serine peptidase [Humibacillus xanthopallidus]TQM64608.1 PA domain-containing protein [Humibacillus xanthopallidus]
MRRSVARPFAVTAAAAAAAVALLAAGGPAAADPADPGRFTARPLQPGSTISAELDKSLAATAKGKDGRVSVIVRLDDEPVASYDGGVRGFPATSSRATGRPFDPGSPASTRYRAHLRQQQATFERAAKAVAPSSVVTARYDLVLGGVAMRVRRDEVASIAALPAVTAVLPDRLEQLQTDASPAFIGAGAMWSSLGGQAKAGEGVIVGVLDTGVWPEHPSFSDPDPTGKPYAAPPPPASGSRACEFSGGGNPGAAFSCNNKLIGADRFMATYDALVGLLPAEFTSARDDDGHGSHTASTAAGNRSVAASILGLSRGVVSGIAPRAHVMAYKVCGEQGCYQSDSVSAVQKAVVDGVDVINFSISGGSNPYSDAVELAFRDAYEAGVFVSASAGNSGPGADTVDHRGPWVTTVAASTSNRHFRSTVQLSSTDGATLALTGSSVTPGIPAATPVVLATAVGSNALCTTPIPAGAAAGKIVVCQRGPNRVLKSKVVADGGGAGMLLYNSTRLGEFTDNHWVPTVHLENTAGTSLLAFLSAHAGVSASWPNPTAQAVQGDVMTTFSSRGGPGQSLGVSKPDVTAPGLQILAANTPAPATSAGGPTGQLFQSIAGTSMSSPHVAGAAALVADLHPSWLPGRIKSALMTTATPDVIASDGVSPTTPFDRGSGRIRLNKAGDPGATFDESGSDYAALGDELWKANYPSLYVPSMPGRITAQRTLHNESSKAAKWKLAVSSPSDLKVTVPSTLTLPASGDASFDIAIDGAGLADGQVRHAQITLSDSPGHRIVFPITVVRGQAPITLTKACAPATLAVNATTSCSITATNSSLTDAPVSIVDEVPTRLDVVDATVTGGTLAGNRVSFTGTVPATVPPSVSIAPGASPGGGYLPLSLFGITPINGVGDDTIINFNVPAFTFGGANYSQLGVSSNGYVVVGGGSGADNSINNQSFPNVARPNNVLAPFWTDLNPQAAGAMRIGTLTDGSNTWIVVDWEGVREFSLPRLASFQIWIGVSGDATPGTDVSYAFGTVQGNGDGGFLTVGAENITGTRGQNTYYNGVGTLPSNGTQLVIDSAAGAEGAQVITFDATGTTAGPWTNCVSMTSPTFDGTSVRCVNGTVTP